MDLGKWLGGGCWHALLFGDTMLIVRHRCWHALLFGDTWLIVKHMWYVVEPKSN